MQLLPKETNPCWFVGKDLMTCCGLIEFFLAMQQISMGHEYSYALTGAAMKGAGVGMKGAGEVVGLNNVRHNHNIMKNPLKFMPCIIYRLMML